MGLIRHPAAALTKAALLCSVALAATVPAGAQEAYVRDEHSLNFLVLNIWNQRQNAQFWDPVELAEDRLVFRDEMNALIQTVNPDFFSVPELNNNNASWNGVNVREAIREQIIAAMELEGGTALRNDSDGQLFSKVPFANLPGNWVVATPDKKFPTLRVGEIHLNYFDSPDNRIGQAKTLNEVARGSDMPVVILGDFNAGDVAERGLHRKEQLYYMLGMYAFNQLDGYQSAQMLRYLDTVSETERQAALDFVASVRASRPVGEALVQEYFDAHRDEFPGHSNIGSLSWAQWGYALGQQLILDEAPFGLEDETYPVAGNLPVTMNILKQQYQLIQREENREDFVPHPLDDKSTTWPSVGEDYTNTWASWDRTTIDHILVSRPFAKWIEIDEDDPNAGNLAELGKLPNGRSLSDHEAVALTLRWIGPQLERYDDEGTEKTRLVFGAEVYDFEARGKEFHLTRNNMRNDLYLGQIADADGNPLLTDLTLEEKKTLLDCASDDPRFQAAIQDYCIDDHSFIGETLVTDGGTFLVDEDAALGGAEATLRLDDGGLRVLGGEMDSLNRAVVLEGKGWLDIEQADNAVFVLQEISGGGDLHKLGAGTLVLTGDHSYSGATSVEAGLFVVNGALASPLTTVESGAGLGGTGTLQSAAILAGGVHTPGNSIGTQSFAGDYANHGTLVIEGTPTENDLLVVQGTVDVTGAELQLLLQPDDPALWQALSDERVFIRNEGGAAITGSFASVESNLLFLDPSVNYAGGAGNDVTFQLARNDVSFDSVAATPNQAATGAAIDSLPTGSPVWRSIAVAGSEESVRRQFDLFSGELHAAIQGALLEDARFARAAIGERVRGAFSQTAALQPGEMTLASAQVTDASGATRADPAGLSFWSKAYGSWGEQRGEDGTATVDRDTRGVFFGGDLLLADSWRVGLMAGYGNGTIGVGERGSSADFDSYTLGAYGGAAFGPVGLRLGAAYSWNDLDSTRHTPLGAAKASYGVDTVQVFGELGYTLQAGAFALEPFAGAAYVHVSSDGYDESGAAGLSSGSSDNDLTFSTLGARVSTGLGLGSVPVTLNAEAGWNHAFGEVDPVVSHSFAGSDSFKVAGAPIARDTAFVGAGVSVHLAENASLGAAYQGQFGDGASDHGLVLKLQFQF